jgi:hypothetical protein
MRKNLLKTALGILAMLAIVPLSAIAQDPVTETPVAQTKDTEREFYMRPSYWIPYDQRGINKFETTKEADPIPFEGLRMRFGAGFTQQFQNIKHENTALNNVGTGSNRLYPLAPGFMTAQANLFTDVQLADGIRLNLTTYLSSRHHNETWVKGGYIQFDKLPIKSGFLDKFMELATIKVGHMQNNYGDAHFRRSDAGDAIRNPFMESYIVDAFATEIGGEVYLQKNGLFGMIGVSNGMIKGHVDSLSTLKLNGTEIENTTKRNPSIYFKGGIDKSLAEKLRVRVSGSLYHNSGAYGSGLTLYSGDRAGSQYNNVMENKPLGTAYTAMYTSGRFNPGFRNQLTAVMLNGFLKAGGLELFGTYETANGKSGVEVDKRNMTQLAGDLIYRFGANENFYVGGRYNTVNSELLIAGNLNDIKINRTALAAGWFVTKNVLMKGEYVTQKYKDFPNTDFRNGGKFNGYVIEAVVGF